MLLSMLTIAKRLVTNLAPVDDVIKALCLLLGELVSMSTVDFLGGILENAVCLFGVGVAVAVAHWEDEKKQDPKQHRNNSYSR